MLKKLIYLKIFLLLFVSVSFSQLSTNRQAKVDKLFIKFNKAINNGDKESASYNMNQIGYIYEIARQYSEAISKYKKAIELTSSNSRKYELNNKIGMVYDSDSKYFDAVVYYKKALFYAKNTSPTNQKRWVPSAYRGISDSYIHNGDYGKAVKNYKDYLKYGIENINKAMVNDALDQIAYTYKRLGDNASSNKYISLKTKSTDDILEIVFKKKSQKRVNDNELKIYKRKLKILADEKGMTVAELEEALKSNDTLQTNLLEISSKLTEREIALKDVEKNLDAKQKELSFTGKVIKKQNLALIIAIGLIVLILIFAILALRGYYVKKKKNTLLAQQKKEIQRQATELNEKNSELKTTLENLKSTQSQLIQSEKMASLGQLIAGIAHELNTPLGAIKSSIGTVSIASKQTIELLPKLATALNQKSFDLLIKMINRGVDNDEHHTSRELRKIKKELRKELEGLNVENVDDIADNLVDMGIYNEINEYIPLFKDKNAELIMNAAYNITGQFKNSENIKTAIDRASKIIYALKSYSHSDQNEEKTKTDISKTINTVLTIYQSQIKQGITIQKYFDEVPEINAFPDKLNQVWTNIIHNSVQAMNGKGTLFIKIRKVDNDIIVSFRDTGKGIPEDIRDKIFTPFFTTKPAGEGTGLGLDIIKKIIEQHNGTITFESEINKGTTFFIKLPIV